MAKVTVLMPVYNGQKYLKEAIDSILGQSFADFEFLIVDDGSTDSSASIIANYDDQRIRLLKNPKRLKLSGALNRGISEARGELIARMDADDIADRRRLDEQVAFMQRNPEYGMCGTWVKRFGGNNSTIDKNPTDWQSIRAYSLFECPFSHPTVILRKEKFTTAGLCYRGDFYPTEDYELWSRAVHLFPCANLPKVLLRYRVHLSGMTGAEWDDMDTQGARIGVANLRLLGLEPSEEELWLHRNIGRAGSRRCHTIGELNRAENWLTKLWDTNSAQKVYPTKAMQEILHLIWFRVCFNSAPLGFYVLWKFTTPPWGGNDRQSGQRSLLLLASIIKHALARNRPGRLSAKEK